MSVTYFGGVSSSAGGPLGTAIDDLGANSIELDTGGSYTTVPGSGSIPVVSLGMYVDSDSGNANFRLAIYGPVDGVHNTTLVMQGSASITAPLSAAWIEHTSFVNASGTPISSPVLTGGAKYRLVGTSTNVNNVKFRYGTGGTHSHWATLGITSFPATLAVLANDLGTEMPDIRVGVTVPVTGSSTPSLKKTTSSVAGVIGDKGTGTPALKKLAPTLSGHTTGIGTGIPVLPRIAPSITGQEGKAGIDSTHLGRTRSSAAGWIDIHGGNHPELQNISPSLIGGFEPADHAIVGSMDRAQDWTLSDVGYMTIEGWITITGGIDIGLISVQPAGTGTQVATGTTTFALNAITPSAGGRVDTMGIVGFSLMQIAPTGAGYDTKKGTGAFDLKTLVPHAAGKQGDQGTAAMALKYMRFHLTTGAVFAEPGFEVGEPEVAPSVGELLDPNHAITHSDRETLMVYSGASPGAWTMPEGVGAFGHGWRCWIYNNTSGDLVLTPDAGTIVGSSSYTIPTNTGVLLWSGGGSKWWIV